MVVVVVAVVRVAGEEVVWRRDVDVCVEVGGGRWWCVEAGGGRWWCVEMCGGVRR